MWNEPITEGVTATWGIITAWCGMGFFTVVFAVGLGLYGWLMENKEIANRRK